MELGGVILNESMENQKLNSIDEAIAEIASGRMIIVVDDAQRENEGDLLMAAEL